MSSQIMLMLTTILQLLLLNAIIVVIIDHNQKHSHLAEAFSVIPKRRHQVVPIQITNRHHRLPLYLSSSRADATQKSQAHSHVQKQQQQEEKGPQHQQQPPQEEVVQVTGVVAPLKYHVVHPHNNHIHYPILSLCFPHLSNHTVYDFLLDTGASVNTINYQALVEPYNLSKQQQQVLPTTSTSNTMSAGMGDQPLDLGSNYMVGNCQLVALPQNFTFMNGLTGYSSSASNARVPLGLNGGLLGLPFFMSFGSTQGGGVEFDWHGTDGDPPTIQFLNSKHGMEDLSKQMNAIVIPIQREPITQVLTIPIRIQTKLNNKVSNDDTQVSKPIKAILDTGSPITIFNPTVAKSLGIIDNDGQTRTDTVIGGGIDGGRFTLSRSKFPISILATTGHNDANDGDNNNPSKSARLGTGHVYVGELPGLVKALNFLGNVNNTQKNHNNDEDEYDESPPDVVLGLDFLQQTYRMLLRVGSGDDGGDGEEQSKPVVVEEVWFEELHNQPKYNPTTTN